MTKRTRIVTACILGIFVILFLLISFAPKHNYSVKYMAHVDVLGKTASPEGMSPGLYVSAGGKYVFYFEWWPEEGPGYITGVNVTNESGESVCALTGQAVRSGSVEMDLKKGRYTFNCEYLTDSEEYADFLKKYIPDATIEDDPSDAFKDGSYDVEYNFSIRESTKNYLLISMACGVLIGILLIILVIELSKKNAEVKMKYDERQILVQGKSFKYSFFTMIIYFVLLVFIKAAKLELPIDDGLLIFLGVALGVCVMVTISIMNDAYFKMNENANVLIGFFIALSVLNLAVGIIHIVSGDVLRDGKLTFTSCGNMLCGIVTLYVLVILLIKKIKDRKED